MEGKTTCAVCKKGVENISALLKVCGSCVRERFSEARPFLEAAHARVRERFNLPLRTPKAPDGARCTNCGNRCSIPPGEVGLCGLVENRDGKTASILDRLYELPHVRRPGPGSKPVGAEKHGRQPLSSSHRPVPLGVLNWYYDPLPTNCVPAEFCAGSSGAGYPRWCRTPRGDMGFYNLSVFLKSCNYNCLYCQNYSFRDSVGVAEYVMTPGELAEKTHAKVGCVCYFGGDPASQMDFVIASAKLIRSNAPDPARPPRLCLETNLSMSRESLHEFCNLALETGGGVKADLKCWSSEMLYALTGVEHRQAYENFEFLASLHGRRREVPLARASTLLVPGYVDDEEIRGLARFIAGLDPTIPYSLLAFHPVYYMADMPYTRRKDVERFVRICVDAGLRNVRVGNPSLLR